MMKKLILSILLIYFSLQLNAQNKLSSKDSISIFYKQLFDNLKSEYLNKKSVNWDVIEKETNQNLAKYENFIASLNQIEILFNKIGATHCSVYFNNNTYYCQPKSSFKEKLTEEWKKEYAKKPNLVTKVINNNIGYILIPSIMFSDMHKKNVNKIAQTLYDEIDSLKMKNNLKGWIIDLRLNTGGNSWPMLLALYDFLGNNTIGGFLNANKKQINTIKLDNGNYYDNTHKSFYIKPNGKLLDNESVAILTSAATASAGEIVALAFKGRKNTIFIGQKTYGATTGNTGKSLPFNSYMALTSSYDCDRNGNYYETIIPDIHVSKQDNYENLLLDNNIKEAIKYLNQSNN